MHLIVFLWFAVAAETPTTWCRWCEPCKMMAQTLAVVGPKMKDELKIFKVRQNRLFLFQVECQSSLLPMQTTANLPVFLGGRKASTIVFPSPYTVSCMVLLITSCEGIPQRLTPACCVFGIGTSSACCRGARGGTTVSHPLRRYNALFYFVSRRRDPVELWVVLHRSRFGAPAANGNLAKITSLRHI